MSKDFENMATVITDASFCPFTKASAWAAWIRYRDKKIKVAELFKRQPKSPHEAELWAIINGVYLAGQLQPKAILVQSDCKTALTKIDARCPELNKTLRRLKGYDFTLITRWVKGHGKDGTDRTWVNNWCDKQAGLLMRSERKKREKNDN